MIPRIAQLNCLLIPMQNKQLLLPNTCIAEIVDDQPPEAPTGGEDWLLGFIRWRGIRLPLLSYEGANGDAVKRDAADRRIAVTNVIGEHAAAMPFMAFRTQGLPKLWRIEQSEIRESANPALGEADVMLVKAGGEEAAIPDLEKMEALARAAFAN